MPWSTISELLVVMGGVGETARSLESTMARLGDIIHVYRQRQTREPVAAAFARGTQRPVIGAAAIPIPGSIRGAHPTHRGAPRILQNGAYRFASGGTGVGGRRAAEASESEPALERVRRRHAAAVRSLLRPLNLGDFDRLLSGVERDVDLQDWRRHTEYSGYTSGDKQVSNAGVFHVAGSSSHKCLLCSETLTREP